MSYMDYYTPVEEVPQGIVDDVMHYFNQYKDAIGNTIIAFMFSDKLPEMIPARIFVMPLISRYAPETPDFYFEINTKAWVNLEWWDKNYLIEHGMCLCRVNSRGNLIPRVIYPKASRRLERP
jgi:hypothetical protein